MVKGLNFMSALYPSQGVSWPVGFARMAKTEHYPDQKTGEPKRRSPVGKNELYRQWLAQAVANHLPLRWGLNEVWFAAAENRRLIQHDWHKAFVMPLKANRQVALSLTDKQPGRGCRLDRRELEANTGRAVYLELVDFPRLLIKPVFANEDGSTGVRYRVTSQTRLTPDEGRTLYRTRWHVEPYHQSLKPNASLEQSPAPTVTTQTNHFFAAWCGSIKLERLKVSTRLNHFALKSKLYRSAVRVAFAA